MENDRHPWQISAPTWSSEAGSILDWSLPNAKVEYSGQDYPSDKLKPL